LRSYMTGMTIVTYVHRPKRQRRSKAQPATATSPEARECARTSLGGHCRLWQPHGFAPRGLLANK
jgi:hypothetical protein